MTKVFQGVIEHDYFGKIRYNWAGFCTQHGIELPYFDTKVEVFLGEEFDEEGEEILDSPISRAVSGIRTYLKEFPQKY